MKQKITDAVKAGKVLVSDGAWGTFLHKKGLQPGECPELWCVERFDDVVDIAGTYFGEATATETEYFSVKENLYFDKIKVGTTKDFALTIILDETTGNHYTNGVLVEITELQDDVIHLESTTEYEGSMSKETTLSLYFLYDGKVITGTETDITFVYGAVAAKEIWSITAQLTGDN